MHILNGTMFHHGNLHQKNEVSKLTELHKMKGINLSSRFKNLQTEHDYALLAESRQAEKVIHIKEKCREVI